MQFLIDNCCAKGPRWPIGRRESIRKYLEKNLIKRGWKKTACDLGLAVGTVRKWAKKFGIKEPPDNRGAKPTKLSVDEEDFILSLYPGKTPWQIASEMDIGPWAIVGFLERKNLYKGFARRSDVVVDKSFFKWSENFAYVLGYLYADGSVGDYNKNDYDGRKSRKISQVSVSSKDKQILEDIRSVMGLRSSVCSYQMDNKTHFSLTTQSRWVYNKFLDFGLTERKSFEGMEIPKVPKHLVRHFIRGFFDGDGCYHLNSGKYPNVNFGCTDMIFLKWVRDSICSFLEITTPKIIEFKNTKTPFYSFNFYKYANVVMGWMRSTKNGIYLHRKWQNL